MQISHTWTDQGATASQISTSMQCPTACIAQAVFRHSHWPRLRTRCVVLTLHAMSEMPCIEMCQVGTMEGSRR